MGIAVLFMIAGNSVLALLGYLLKVTPSPGVLSLFPNGPTEIALYVTLTFVKRFFFVAICKGSSRP